MHRSRLSQWIIDCRTDDLDRAASFWAQVLGYAADALPDPEDARYRKLRTPAGQPNILVQQVVHPSRVHLDLESDDVEAEVRPSKRSARSASNGSRPGGSWKRPPGSGSACWASNVRAWRKTATFGRDADAGVNRRGPER